MALFLFMSLVLLVSISNLTEAISLSVKIDNGDKSARPGETVYFNWTIKNTNDTYTYDLRIYSDPETLFNPANFTLPPGEEQLVNQTVQTSKSDENGTRYLIDVIIDGEYYVIQPIPGHTNKIGATSHPVTITILNESGIPEHFKPVYSSNTNVMLFGIFIFIVLTLISIYIILKRKRKHF